MLTKLRVYLRIYWFCFLSIWKLNIGDAVVYQGKRYLLTQGVKSPYWNLGGVDTSEFLNDIHSSEFRKERTLTNVLFDMQSTYRFYMGYWFDIYVNMMNQKHVKQDNSRINQLLKQALSVMERKT